MNILPQDAKERKRCPIWSGVVKYFPNALIAVARRSQDGNDQHHPDKPLHWDKSKSGDEMDALMRHAIEGDWEAVAWRALAMCEREIENGYVPSGFKDLPPTKDKTMQGVRPGFENTKDANCELTKEDGSESVHVACDTSKGVPKQGPMSYMSWYNTHPEPRWCWKTAKQAEEIAVIHPGEIKDTYDSYVRTF